ncbi:MAG TPA: hypothetical protein VFP48_04885 [Steroidobacteraceae bacterium]|nr:hypothetical protein [Steroidobacteraceae bacterium]
MSVPALAARFPAYAQFDPRVPVHCVTPTLAGAIHRFYDSSPFSPSGRYLAVLRMPNEHRLPRPGEIADIHVVDLATGETAQVAETRGWDAQLGAHVQWGADDRTLLFNDVDPATWTAFGVRLDPLSGDRQRLDGTVYAVSPDGAWSASPCLRRTLRTQRGYGVVVPEASIPKNRGAPSDDGIYLTDLRSGASRLLTSIADIVRGVFAPDARARYDGGDFYGFHLKWNAQGTRLLFVLRWLPRTWLPWRRKKRHRRLNVVTLAADGSNPRIAIPDTAWRKGGNHPNWCPDGERVLMNLNASADGLRFVAVRHDGTELQVLSPEARGSGHPTLHPDGRHILTDAYPHEPVAFGDGTTPLRWIELPSGRETTLLRIHTRSAHEDSVPALRVDPHPAWDRDYRFVAFNANPDGTRRVYVADLREYVGIGTAAA